MRALVLAIAAVSSIAVADSKEEATRLFEEGRALAASQGKFAEACDRFAKSLELERAPGTELNLGDCHEHLGHLAEAHRWFLDAAAAFDDRHDAQRADYARTRAATLEPRLGTLVVSIDGADREGVVIKIAGRRAEPAAKIEQLVDPGTVEVSVEAPGAPPIVRTRTVDAGERKKLRIELPAAPVAEAAAPASRHGHRGAWRVTFYSSIAAGLVGGGIYLYGRNEIADATDQLCTGGAYSQIDASCPPPYQVANPLTADQVAALNDKGWHGHTLAVAGSLTLAIAGGLAAVSLYEGFLAPDPQPSRVAVTPLVAPGTAGAVVYGAW